MQKHIAWLLIIASLSGCASSRPVSAGNTGADNFRTDDFVQKKAIEEAGWARLGALSVTQCGASPVPPERGKAMELSNCITGLVNEYVMPGAAFPALLSSSREEALRIAKDYDDGKISTAAYKTRSEERLKHYKKSLIYFANQQTPSNIG